ncbi:hypothetical protein NHJ13734_009593, partial [Beauveria thailandica]
MRKRHRETALRHLLTDVTAPPLSPAAVVLPPPLPPPSSSLHVSFPQAPLASCTPAEVLVFARSGPVISLSSRRCCSGSGGLIAQSHALQRGVVAAAFRLCFRTGLYTDGDGGDTAPELLGISGAAAAALRCVRMGDDGAQ